MNNTLFFQIRWLATFVALFWLAANREAHAEQPNFVIFIADDMAWNDCGAYGHPRIRTPNIDRLAEDGLRFETAWLTCSSCSPSRCSILTSLYPHATGARNLHEHLPKEKRLFTKELRATGYYTAASGKWHLGPHAKQDFDAVMESNIGDSGCDRWLEAVDKRPRDKPFFLWLASKDPHRDYKANTIKVPHDRDDVVVPPYLPDAAETRDDLAMYYDEISRFDENVGSVLKELERQGVAENTMILVMSDNGRPFPRCKTTVYDSGVKTPFIVRFPDVVKAGGISKSLVSSIDIGPTILTLAGVAPPTRLQGVSFDAILGDPTATTRDYLFAEHNWHDYQAYERAVRDDHFIYIRNWLPGLPGTPPADAVRSPTYALMKQRQAKGNLAESARTCFERPRPSEELYDSRSDPHSLNNLADDPDQAERMRSMRSVLSDWRDKTADSLPEEHKPDGFDRITGKRLKK